MQSGRRGRSIAQSRRLKGSWLTGWTVSTQSFHTTTGKDTSISGSHATSAKTSESSSAMRRSTETVKFMARTLSMYPWRPSGTMTKVFLMVSPTESRTLIDRTYLLQIIGFLCTSSKRLSCLWDSCIYISYFYVQNRWDGVSCNVKSDCASSYSNYYYPSCLSNTIFLIIFVAVAIIAFVFRCICMQRRKSKLWWSLVVQESTARESDGPAIQGGAEIQMLECTWRLSHNPSNNIHSQRLISTSLITTIPPKKWNKK